MIVDWRLPIGDLLESSDLLQIAELFQNVDLLEGETDDLLESVDVRLTNMVSNDCW